MKKFIYKKYDDNNLYINKMSKDYSILYELPKDKTNEKEIEEKYSEFLDWLKEYVEKNKVEINERIIAPVKFVKLLFDNNLNQNGDIFSYLDKKGFFLERLCCSDIYHRIPLEIHLVGRIKNKSEYFLNIEKPKLEQKISSLEQSNQDILKKLKEQIQLNTFLHDKLPKLEEQISELKQTNEEILSKLQEQIILNEEFSKLNSKLCERIFEMKEEKFKDEKN